MVAAEEDEWIEADFNLEEGDDKEGDRQQEAPDRTKPFRMPSMVPSPPSCPQSVPTKKLRYLCLEPPCTRMLAVVEGPHPPFPPTHASQKGHDQ